MAGEYIWHYNGVRLRVVGTGNLKMSLYSFDKIESVEMTPLVMSSTNAQEPTRLTNFISQRAILRLETTEINETFRVNRIILFTKPLYKSYAS